MSAPAAENDSLAVEPAWPAWKWWCWLAGPEALVLVSILLGDRLPFLSLPGDSLLMLRVGIVGAQISLAAAVAAWTPWPLFLRVGTSWMWMLAAVLALAWFGGLNPSVDIILCTVAVIQWLLVVGMFAAAWTFGIRLVDRQQRILQTDSVRQFSLQDLLLFTAEVALILALARAAWPDFALRWRMFDSLQIFFFWVAVAIGNILLFNAVVTCFHVPRPHWKNLLWCLFFAALITSLLTFTFWKLAEPGDPWLPYLKWAVWINAAQLAWLRFALWRLERANVYLRRMFHPKFTGMRWPGN